MNRLFAWFGLPGTVVLTVLMSMTALTAALVLPTPDRWLRFTAMLFGSLGDLILMNDPRVRAKLPPFLRSFTAGGAVFFLSHLLYGTAFAVRSVLAGVRTFEGWFWAGPLLAGALAVLLLLLQRRGGGKDFPMLALFGLYFLAICSVFGLVLAFALEKGGAGWLTVAGSVSFIISDYLIALGRLTPFASRQNDLLVWWFYPAGQLLLILS